MFDQPSVILTSRDFALLENLEQQWGEPFPGAAEIIRRKLAAATLVIPADVPADVVTLNSRVRFSTSSGQADERVIVAGPSEEIYGLTMLLASPRGLALIGAAVGHTVASRRRKGSLEQLFIEALLYQPERNRNRSVLRVVSARMPDERRAASGQPGTAAVRPVLERFTLKLSRGDSRTWRDVIQDAGCGEVSM